MFRAGEVLFEFCDHSGRRRLRITGLPIAMSMTSSFRYSAHGFLEDSHSDTLISSLQLATSLKSIIHQLQILSCQQ